MWKAETEDLGRSRRTQILAAGKAISYAIAIDGWRRDEAFRSFFLNELSAAPFRAYFWETRPVIASTVDGPFEYVLTDSPGLTATMARPDAFAKHFAADSASSVVSFANLSGDATLVVPRPMGDAGVYPHIAAFVRAARPEQKHALLQRVGASMVDRISARTTTWLSTSGLGVPWLHVRLDSRPKYYNFQPYKDQDR